VLEHGFARLMREAQCGDRMDREGEIHDGFYISDNGRLNHVDLHGLTGGNSVIVYGQTELTRDLYEARDRMGGIIIHNADDVRPHDVLTSSPYLTCTHENQRLRVDGDFIVGADGFHVVSRKSIPGDVLREYERIYLFGWLGFLSRTRPV